MARRNNAVAQPVAQPSIRCAIYTRKSTTDGLEMDFNTLDAQRESCEAYILSQRDEGWIALPEMYDDGGFTGGNMERPAFQRLMADIKAGKIDCVVVYKVDRLSRSLMDFTKIIEIFDEHGVTFSSITQQFCTANSMGRLMLNVLLSFAQFERELVSERTRDKIAAARKKGKWPGGSPLLGYDIAPESRKLIVNEAEAAQVREIYEMYLANGSMIETVETLNERGWKTKCWVTRKGKSRGGEPFDKSRLYRLLTSVGYIGKVPHKENMYEGEHEAIIDTELWDKVQAIMRHNGAVSTRSFQNKYGSLLRGMVYCSSCGCAMTHSFTKKQDKMYRYYVCTHAMKRGWKSCPNKSVPAAEIEDFVVERIREISRDPALIEETIKQVAEKKQSQKPVLVASRNRLKADITHLRDDARRLVEALTHETISQSQIISEQISNIENMIAERNRQLTEVNDELLRIDIDTTSPAEIRKTIEAFDPIWDVLYVKEKIRIISLLIERVTYNGADGTVAITFRDTGIKQLSQEMAN